MAEKFITTLLLSEPCKESHISAGLVDDETIDFSMVDYNKFAKQIEDTCNEVDNNGYDVVNILPIYNRSRCAALLTLKR